MRASRLSRVTPALFTRIATGPKSACTFSTKAAHAAASRTSSTRPAPLAPASAIAFEIASAPFSEVAVPTTVAPALASACSDALADAARGSGHDCHLSVQHVVSALLQGRGERGGILDGDAFDARRRCAFVRPVSTLPGAHSTMRVTPWRREELDGLDPAHGMVELLDQCHAGCAPDRRTPRRSDCGSPAPRACEPRSPRGARAAARRPAS